MPTIAVYHIRNMRDFPSWEDSRILIERAVAVADYDHVFTYEARDTPLFEDGVPYNVLEHAFREFNIGDYTAVGSLAWHYRRAGRQPDELGNRSLSVGDVVTVETAGYFNAYVCASLGWQEVTDAWALVEARM